MKTLIVLAAALTLLCSNGGAVDHNQSIQVRAAIAEMKNETPEVIISLGKPVIFGATPSMKRVTEFGAIAAADLWKEVEGRADAKVVAMCAVCVQKIGARIEVEAIEREIAHWNERSGKGQADLAITSLRRLKMALEGKIKKRSSKKGGQPDVHGMADGTGAGWKREAIGPDAGCISRSEGEP